MLGVVARGRLRAGLATRSFAVEELMMKSEGDGECVYIDVDDTGFISPAGLPSLGPSIITRTARLAPDVHARTAVLEASGEGLNVRLLTDLPPGAELLLWFEESLLAKVDMPFLTLKNIRGKKDYVCHDCDVQFERPNHLKIHLFLQCREFSATVFWRRFHAKLTDRVPPYSPISVSTDRLLKTYSPTNASTGRLSETISPVSDRKSTPYTPSHRISAFKPYVDIVNSPINAPAQLEALAAEWGRSSNGHLCLYCGKIYSRKYGLKIHIRTHTGYKPLRCRYCLRAFGDPSNLNKHVRLHANENERAGDHACPVCGKRLARRRDLLRHVRARHATALAASGTTSPCAVP